MKSNRMIFRLVSIVAISTTVACSSIKLEDNLAGAAIESRTGTTPGSANLNTRQGAGGTGSPDAQAGAGANDPNRVGTVTIGAGPLTPEQKALMEKRSIYFEYDSFSIRSEDQRVLEAHARDLLNIKSKKILIQGNTDERGGSEYNLALGQKRAEAVRKALAALGVPDAQMEAVSLGKEKPKAAGNSEQSYAENRRADLVY